MGRRSRETMEAEGRCDFIILGDEVWQVGESESDDEPPPARRIVEEEEVAAAAAAATTTTEAEQPELEVVDPDDKPNWMTVSQYRRHWNKLWSAHDGSFEDTTRILPMRFTDKPAELGHAEGDTLQIFSVKLAATRGSLQLPLHVFGMVAVRDPVDHNRNIIFQRTRDDCQTLTEKDPYLVLEGPTRAVVLSDSRGDPSIVEVDLKVKGTTEPADECLSFFVAPVTCCPTMYSRVFSSAYTSKLSRLEFTMGHIVFSVEATIFVRVLHGSWPFGLRGLFAATTTGLSDRCPTEYSTGVGHEKIILLDSGSQEVPVAGDGKIPLSRHVISTQQCGELIFQVKALEGNIKVVEKDIIFHPLEAGKSISELDISFCGMEVTVFWSRVSCYP